MAFWSFNVTSSYTAPFCFSGVSSCTWTCTWGGSKHSFWQTCSILICDPLVGDQRMVTHSCSRSILGVLPLVIKRRGSSRETCCRVSIVIHLPFPVGIPSYPPSPLVSSGNSLWQIHDLASSDERGSQEIVKLHIEGHPHDQKGTLSRTVEGE